MPPPPVNVAKTAVTGLLRLPATEQAFAKRSLHTLSETFGQPHKQAGIGIRKLKGAVFECRINKSIRAIFVWRNGSIWIETIGNHEDVKRFLKLKKSKIK
jgi:hypothetical protein